MKRLPSFSSATRDAGNAGFTLIEMIGVVALVAIMAAIITPNLARKISSSAGEREDKMLEVLGEGVMSYIRTYQVIPGANSWITNVAAVTGLSSNEVRRVNVSDAASARVYLVNFAFQPSTASGGGFADPVWTQTAAGATTVTSPRILIISTHKSSLTLPVTSGRAASQAAFDAIWDWTFDPATKAPPGGWPSAWSGNGEYLHVERVNLTPHFRRVVINNLEYPDTSPYYQVGTATMTLFSSAATLDRYFLDSSFLRFYKDDANGNDLDLSYSLNGTANFIYENDAWRMP